MNLAGGELIVLLTVLALTALPAAVVAVVVLRRPAGTGMTPTGAGWYADPTRQGLGWRWWDGSTWTEWTELNPPDPKRSA